MTESQTFEYRSDDIGDEDVILEWEARPSGQPPLCPRDGHPMTEQQQTYTPCRRPIRRHLRGLGVFGVR